MSNLYSRSTAFIATAIAGAAFSVLALPAFAAEIEPGTGRVSQVGVSGLIDKIGGLINDLIPLIIAIAVIGFLWGLAMFIFKAGNDEEQKKARSIMIWGILALFVMVSVWGLVAMLQATFGSTLGDPTKPLPVPKASKPS